MSSSSKQSRRTPPGSPASAERRRERGCKCTVQLDPDKPILLDKAETGPKGTFKPNYQKEPSCAGNGCEKQVHYRWSIEITEGKPVLGDATEEKATVSGTGRFKLTVEVSVGCTRVIADDGEGHKTMAVTPCSDTGSRSFAVL